MEKIICCEKTSNPETATVRPRSSLMGGGDGLSGLAVESRPTITRQQPTTACGTPCAAGSLGRLATACVQSSHCSYVNRTGGGCGGGGGGTSLVGGAGRGDSAGG